MMKQNKLKSLLKTLPMAIAITAMTAACTSNEDSQGTVKLVSFEGNAAVPTTRGFLTEPGDFSSNFSYKWLKDDKIKVMLADPAKSEFLTDGFWDASVAPAADSSAAEVGWKHELNISPNTTYRQILVSAPDSLSTIDVSGTDTKYVSCNLASTTTDATFTNSSKTVMQYTQDGYNNMNHLKPYYFIYSNEDITTDADGNLPAQGLSFKYEPVIFRIVVLNNSEEKFIVNSVGVIYNEAAQFGYSPFRTSCKIGFDKSKGAFDADNAVSEDKIDGMKISVVNPTVLGQNDNARLYGLIPSYTSQPVTPAANNTFTFYVQYTDDSTKTVKYANIIFDPISANLVQKDKNSQYRYQFWAGYCYTIILMVDDDALSLKAMGPENPFTGWNDDNTMIEH